MASKNYYAKPKAKPQKVSYSAVPTPRNKVDYFPKPGKRPDKEITIDNSSGLNPRS